MSPEERFESLRAGFQSEPGVTGGAGDAPRKAFGASALKVGGKIFAMLARSRLVVKLPRERVAALVESGAGTQFDPGHGRPMREWLSVDPEAPLDWDALSREALVFVGGGPRVETRG